MATEEVEGDDVVYCERLLGGAALLIVIAIEACLSNEISALDLYYFL